MKIKIKEVKLIIIDNLDLGIKQGNQQLSNIGFEVANNIDHEKVGDVIAGVVTWENNFQVNDEDLIQFCLKQEGNIYMNMYCKCV